MPWRLQYLEIFETLSNTQTILIYGNFQYRHTFGNVRSDSNCALVNKSNALIRIIVILMLNIYRKGTKTGRSILSIPRQTDMAWKIPNVVKQISFNDIQPQSSQKQVPKQGVIIIRALIYSWVKLARDWEFSLSQSLSHFVLNRSACELLLFEKNGEGIKMLEIE